MKRKVRFSEQTVVDNTTGEVLTEKTMHSWKVGSEDNFLKFYVKFIGYFNALSKAEIMVFICSAGYMDYKNEVFLSKTRREEIAKSCKITFGTVNKSISNLAKKKLFFRKDRSLYTVNPEFFGKGKWSDIIGLRDRLEYAEYEFEI